MTTALRVAVSPVLLAAAVLVQLAVLSRLPLPGPTPNLVLLVVVALAIAAGPLAGTLAGFAGGLALDLVPPADTATGRWAFALCLVGYLAGLAKPAAEQSLLAVVAVVALASGGALLLYAVLGLLLDDVRVTWVLVGRLLPLSAFYDVLLIPLVVPGVLALVARSTDRPARYGSTTMGR